MKSHLDVELVWGPSTFCMLLLQEDSLDEAFNVLVCVVMPVHLKYAIREGINY